MTDNLYDNDLYDDDLYDDNKYDVLFTNISDSNSKVYNSNNNTILHFFNSKFFLRLFESYPTQFFTLISELFTVFFYHVQFQR